MSTEGRRKRVVYIPCLIRTMKSIIRRLSDRIGTRLIVRLVGLLCYPIALHVSYNTRFLCSKVVYRRQIYRKIQCIYIAQQSL